MKNLLRIIDIQEDWLMEQVLSYAKKHGYAKYTSTLVEPWRQSISGLNQALRFAYQSNGCIRELGADETYLDDPATEFAVIDAKRHRDRGVGLAMFLGLFKFYRQSYMDLVAESDFPRDEKQEYLAVLRRFFDRIEIAFCSEWAGESLQDHYRELQTANLELTNEKNKYLTIFNSFSQPVFLIDLNKCLVDMNYAASLYLGWCGEPGSHYYRQRKQGQAGEQWPEACPELKMLLPWLTDDFEGFIKDAADTEILEKTFEGKSYEISLARMRDISGKFSGVVVILYDVTKEKEAIARKEERDKLQAAIETAGAVCHEMSQPMQVLLMRAEIAKLKASGDPVLQEELDTIMEQITQMGEITHRLLGLTTYKTRIYINGTDILDLT
jgi:PAS domain-containing protein